jgi:long-chain acyl-CoA synthetase
MGSFPLFFNKIYEKTIEAISKQGTITKAVFNQAIKAKIENIDRNAADTTHVVYDNLVFSKVRAVLGGRLRMVISGGAPLS